MPRITEYTIRELEERDLELVLNWRNFDRIRKFMYNDYIITQKEHRCWFESLKVSDNRLCLVCEYIHQPIGIVNISQYDRKNNRCYWGFYLGDIQAPAASAKIMGYLALNYLFDILAVHKVCSEVLIDNIKSIKYHEQYGFVLEGTLREHIYKDGRYQDIISMALFRRQWDDLRIDYLKKIEIN